MAIPPDAGRRTRELGDAAAADGTASSRSGRTGEVESTTTISRHLEGQCIGPYLLGARIGAGGMGEVYRARDTRLDRTVAIKVLPAHEANDPLARERFEREARTVAALNHPHICTLHDVGRARIRSTAGAEQDIDFLVMEYLDGETLAARLTRGALPIDDTLRFAADLASALDGLHTAGIIHRDLKPANIMLATSGVKLLDFGIAKGLPAHSLPVDADTELTAPGTILGTLHYMAPEQLEGLRTDARSDLFSFGCVLYEMLTGGKAFEGRSPASLVAAVVAREPDPLSERMSVLPDGLEDLVSRCLAKSPEQRWQTAGDLRAALERIANAARVVLPASQPVSRLIVLPFRMLRADAEVDFLSFSLPDALAASLSNLQSIVVRSSLVAARFSGDAPDLRTIADEADVNLVVTGTLLRAGERLRVTTQLADAVAGTLIWSHTADAALDDLFRLQDSLVDHIVASLELPLTAREQRLLKRDVPASAKAYECFLRANQISHGARVWTDLGTWTLARDLYIRCVEEDPRFAPAWAALGRVYRVMAKYTPAGSGENFAQADSALRRALDLNPDLSSAHGLYAQLEIDLGRSRDAMVRLLEHARIRRNDPGLFVALCQACRYCGLLEASIAAHEHAARLDSKTLSSVAHTYYVRGDYPKVVEIIERSWGGYGSIGLIALAAVGRQAEAINAARRMEETAPPLMRALIVAARCVIEGNRNDGVPALMQAAEGFSDPEVAYYCSRQFARFGDHRRALEALGRAYDGGYNCFEALNRDSWFDALRDDPQFRQITQQFADLHRSLVTAFVHAGGPALLGKNGDLLRRIHP